MAAMRVAPAQARLAAAAPARRRLLGACALAALPWPAARAQPPAPPVPAQQPAPPTPRAQPAPLLDWALLVGLDGAPLRPADWDGTPAVVVFWATWCGFCRRHNARLERLRQDLGGRPPRLLGVAMDGPSERVREHVQRHRLGFAMAMDDGRLHRSLALPRTVPTTCLVDAASRLVQVISGEMAEDDVAALARIDWVRPPR